MTRIKVEQAVLSDLDEVAKQLLQAAGEYARMVGAVRLTLSAATTNEQAQALYKLTGWSRGDHFQTFNLVINT